MGEAIVHLHGTMLLPPRHIITGQWIPEIEATLERERARCRISAKSRIKLQYSRVGSCIKLNLSGKSIFSTEFDGMVLACTGMDNIRKQLRRLGEYCILPAVVRGGLGGVHDFVLRFGPSLKGYGLNSRHRETLREVKRLGLSRADFALTTNGVKVKVNAPEIITRAENFRPVRQLLALAMATTN